MPQYEFECQNCNKTFERTLALSAYTEMMRKKNIACPHCGSTKVVRVISAPMMLRMSGRPMGGGGCCPGGGCG